MNITLLDSLFTEYGYKLKEQTNSYRVYVLHQGMYYGAEIIMLDNSDPAIVQSRYSNLGYSVKIQHFNDVNNAEDYLFKGFFKTSTTVIDIQKRYNEFAEKQIRHYGDSSIKYEYINMPYIEYTYDAEEEKTGKNLINSIWSVFNQPGAHLVIVEAAAGFGKTCTAYELYKSFIKFGDSTKPLFTELSRNRDVKQFKYVLWAEIDKEQETTAKQELVIYNIKKGRIPLIIDGFDELLTKDIDPGKAESLNEFEQVETMLSTIGDLLRDNAKIVLTSRRTAIFAGSEFEEWVNSYNGSFNVVRFQLNKPNVKEWLSSERYEQISSRNIPLEHISNPVLLTYLRNVDKSEFSNLLDEPENITDKYFEYLLNREKERQDLIIPYKEQMTIYENLAKSFYEFDITGEARSFVKELIIEYNKQKLTYYRELSPTKQSLEELADTLTNHALLDRIGNSERISFINDFVFGFLLGKSLIKPIGKTLIANKHIPEDLLERSISAFRYARKADKEALWAIISSIKGKLTIEHQITLDSSLCNTVHGTYNSIGINSLSFDTVSFLRSNCQFTNTSFVDITFEKCTFDPNAFQNVTFTGCRFISCQLSTTENEINKHLIQCYGCEDYQSDFISLFKANGEEPEIKEEKKKDIELLILSKYFKVDGKSTKMKYISNLRNEFMEDSEDIDEVFSIFESMRKRGYILTRGNNSFITQAGINHYHKKSQS